MREAQASEPGFTVQSPDHTVLGGEKRPPCPRPAVQRGCAIPGPGPHCLHHRRRASASAPSPGSRFLSAHPCRARRREQGGGAGWWKPLTSDAHEAVGEDGQVDGVELGTHRAGDLSPHGDADVPSLSHLCLAAWLHQDGTGGREQRGCRSQATHPSQPGTPCAQAQKQPSHEGTPESFRLLQSGPENPPPGPHRSPQPRQPWPWPSPHLLLSMMRQGPCSLCPSPSSPNRYTGVSW